MVPSNAFPEFDGCLPTIEFFSVAKYNKLRSGATKSMTMREYVSIVVQVIQRKVSSLFLFLGFVIFCFNLLQSQELILPAPDMPAFTLGSVNQSKDAFGRPSVTIDYQRLKEGVGTVKLSGRTSNGPLSILGFDYLSEASGKLDLSSLFFNGGSLNAELYLTTIGSFAEECPFNCLVSNVVSVGNPSGPTINAREWNSLESIAYQKELVGRKPPLSPPPGHQLVQGSTKLLAGMPIKVGRFGEWADAEVIVADSTVTAKIENALLLRMFKRSGWIAIKPSVLAQGDSASDSFKPSVQAIPGTTEILPDGYVVLKPEMKIVPGTPVKAVWLSGLVDSTVVSIEEQHLLIHFDSPSLAFEKKLIHSVVVIARTTLDELDRPGATEKFADRVPKKLSFDEQLDSQMKRNEEESKRVREQVERNSSESQKGMFSSPPGNDTSGLPALPLMEQNNPIQLPIPKEAELLPLDFPIPRGTKLAVCWSMKWNYVTVLKDNTDDTVPIHWDDRTSESDGLIHRTQLIIRKTDLKKLRAKIIRQGIRVWTDATGKHTVEAKIVSRTETHVALIKNDGKEVKLSIDKLSAADQKWLKDNP